jgi:hypothetical protein
MGHRTVMLSAAKHLAAQCDRPFAASSLRSEQVWLSVTVDRRDKSAPTSVRMNWLICIIGPLRLLLFLKRSLLKYRLNKRCFGISIAFTIRAKPVGQFFFQEVILLGILRMKPKVVAEEDMFIPSVAPRLHHVHMVGVLRVLGHHRSGGLVKIVSPWKTELAQILVAKL